MKKALSLALVIVMLFTLGFLAFAEEVTTVVDDNPPRTNCSEVAAGDTMNTNYGSVVMNNGTINTNAEYERQTYTECANGFIYANGTTGQVGNNYGWVDTNTGIISNNEGYVKTNGGTIDTNGEFVSADGEGLLKGFVAENRGLVDVNDGFINSNSDKGTVNVNNGTVVNNNEGTVDVNNSVVINNEGSVNFNIGSVDNNASEVVKNYGYVKLVGEEASVTENRGIVVNGECNAQGETTYKPGSIVYSVNYLDGGTELGYCNLTETLGAGDTWPTASVTLASSEDFGISKFGHAGKWTIYDEYDDTTWDFYPGDIFYFSGRVNFFLGWDKTINADICFEDENGVYEGRSFLLNQPIENFQNVSCNAAYLEKGVDYTVEAEDGMTRVKLTDKFFEKNGDGPIAVAPLFVGAIYYLYAVKG